MKKIDKTVKKETLYIAVSVLIMSTLMQAVFLIVRRWDYTVLLGNLLSAAAAILNFLLMGITVQHATDKEEKQAKSIMRASQGLRMLMLFGIAVLGVLLDCFNTVSAIVPLFFPRIAIAFRQLSLKKQKTDKA